MIQTGTGAGLDYCGARAYMAPEQGLALDPDRWAWMPKIDGCYARVELDAGGAIATVTSRTGRALREAADLLGVIAGDPHAVLHGELEAHTEAGNAAARARGWRNLHLFDVTRIGDRDLKPENYAARYATLHRMQAALELTAHGRITPWRTDRTGRRHDDRNGRFVPGVPRDLRRLPVVELRRGRRSGAELWREHVELGRGEGLVAVRLDAPVAARGGKRKVKARETLDALVLARDASVAQLVHRGRVFFAPAAGLELVVGQVVEVLCDGWYETGAPRFARILRQRRDVRYAWN